MSGRGVGWPEAFLVVGVAVAAAAGPALLAWVTNAPNRLAAKHMLEIVSEPDEEEEPGWPPNEL